MSLSSFLIRRNNLFGSLIYFNNKFYSRMVSSELKKDDFFPEEFSSREFKHPYSPHKHTYDKRHIVRSHFSDSYSIIIIAVNCQNAAWYSYVYKIDDIMHICVFIHTCVRKFSFVPLNTIYCAL